MLERKFVQNQRNWLQNKLKSKVKILKKGGEHAALHSLSDITRIEFALSRIDTDQYGLCTQCGNLIEKDRLRIFPETPFCSLCAKELEYQPRTN